VSAEDRLFDVDYGLRDHQRTRLISLSGKVRHDAPDTSREAARLIAPKVGTKRQQVLREIAMSAPQGVTDEGICLALGMNPSTERPRRVELVEAGWVEDSGERLLLRSGTHAILWRLTQRGREAL
jgi:hypothetical protein